MLNKIIKNNFLLIIIGFSIVGLIEPILITFIKPYIPFFLSFIMFCIGITTEATDFKSTFDYKWKIPILVLIRFTIMPVTALFIAIILNLSNFETVGLLIIGACPGGTAANVMAYISKSNVALTVILTFLSTIISPIITPLLILIFLHKYVSISHVNLILHISIIVILPICIGCLVKIILKNKIYTITKYLPAAAIIVIALIISCILALNQTKILSLPIKTIAAITLLNISGYILGLFTFLIMKLKKTCMLPIIFEYGMFDTALAVGIASIFFNAEAAIPAAFLSIIQNLTAPILIKYNKFLNTKLNKKNIQMRTNI